MYVRHLEITDFKAFASAKVDFAYPRQRQDEAFEHIEDWPPRLRNVNLLLGVNGAGKTTILRAIALAALSPLIGQSGYRPYTLVRRSAAKNAPERAVITAKLALQSQDGWKPGSDRVRTVKTIVERRGDGEFIRGEDFNDPQWDSMFQDKSPAFLIVGYGALRRVEVGPIDSATRNRERALRYERIASLLDGSYTLRPLSNWLPSLKSENPDRFQQVVSLIHRLSGAGVGFTGAFERGEYLFKTRRALVPFTALSDGHQAYLSWISDLLYHLCMGSHARKKLTGARGVVLVDEIDLHIHPEWQRTIIPKLARALPRLQFVFTSHSPIVVGTLERANIIRVESGRSGAPRLVRPDAELHGLSADQILRSDAFGLDSTRDPEFARELDRFSKDVVAGKASATDFMRLASRGKGAALGSEAPSAPTMPDWVRKLAAKPSR
jgi:hypothetical protein